jgi:hypothetical protein
MALEVITRDVYTITDPALAQQIRRALAADNIDLLDDLMTYLEEFSDTCQIENRVLTVTEVIR